MFVQWRLAVPLLLAVVANCQFDWQTRDNFDEIRRRLDKVHAENCDVVDINDLFLPPSTVTHTPDITQLGNEPVYPNRTNLLQVHNLALSRAFFFSYILEKASDESEPGFMYYFLSTIADVAANKYINASSIYYGPNLAFTPSYKGFYNKTMPLFAPRAFRADDFNDPYHLQGTSTLNTIEASDLGAIPKNSISINYTHEEYKINEWLKPWLPDYTKRQDSKTTYNVHITHANGTNETFVFHGPPARSDTPGPVKWSRPYFDCKRSNKWVFSASSPIPALFPRHTGWRHIEVPIYVGVVVMEVDFERIDVNQCPIGEGNPGPNSFAGTARCKNSTTECEPIHGYGFRRGGYQCRCKPGFRLPKVARTPYLGEVVERATQYEYNKGFGCDKIGFIATKPQNLQRLSEYDRMRLTGRIETATGIRGNSSMASTMEPDNVAYYTKHVVNPNTCRHYLRNQPERLILPGSVAFSKDERFENQARLAVRLANFISSFLQVVKPEEMFAEFRVPDRSLTADQIIGEALSLVIGDVDLISCGVLFDRSQFPNRTHFAPYAYRVERNDRSFYVDDLSRKHAGTNMFYMHTQPFSFLKTRWSSNMDELETFTTKINIRYNSSGLYSVRYDNYPLQYKAANLNHGHWTSPYFDCGGFHNKWLITYGVPFFGHDKIMSRLEFKGIVTVSMLLQELDINQCSDDNSDDNAFKNTHKCDRRSSRCVPIMRRKFAAGGYKCECNQGYEYPFNDDITYFDGQILESQYVHMLNDEPSRFDQLECRIAGASHAKSSAILALLTFVFIMLNFL